MKRVALCIGNNYPNSGNDLYGCVNDAVDWARTLGSRGYEPTMLTEATREQTIESIRSFAATLRVGDRIIFQYSGHGTWVPDSDGDEADGRDEAICPVDFRDAGVITDDELYQLFGSFRSGVRRLIISDSCYSGTVSRAVTLETPYFAGTPKFVPPDQFLDGAALEAARRVEKVTTPSTPRGGTILLSGCSDQEVSYDAVFNGRANGALSYQALMALNGDPTVWQWYKSIRTKLPSRQHPQTPQLGIYWYQKLWKL